MLAFPVLSHTFKPDFTAMSSLTSVINLANVYGKKENFVLWTSCFEMSEGSEKALGGIKTTGVLSFVKP